MKKKIILTAVSILVLFMMTACPSPPSIMGNEPIFIGGHFLTDHIYNGGEYIDSYYSDGTYEAIDRSWNDDSGEWEQSDGERGTYEYDTSKNLMTRYPTEIWNRDGNEEWQVYTEWLSVNNPEIELQDYYETYNLYFTGNGAYSAYNINADGNWEYIFYVYYEETENGVDNIFEFEESRVYTLNGTEFNYFQENSIKNYEDSALYPNYQREWGGDVTRLAPTDIEWKKGKTVTFYYTETVNRSRNWDTTNSVWNDYNDWTYTDIRSATFTHMSDFILEVSAQSMKSLE